MKQPAIFCRVLALVAAAGIGPVTASAQAINYERLEVAPGVHVFRANEPGAGNAVAVVSGETALVIDATASPATARTIIAELVKLGVRRLRGVVHTHWHSDHTWGTQAFLEGFPSTTVIAHTETRLGSRDITTPDLAVQIARIHDLVAERDSLLRSGINAGGEPMTAEEVEALERRQAVFRELVAGLEEVRPVLPHVTFDRTIRVHVGSLEVELTGVGPAHSSGDLVVHVPSLGVLIAGDILTEPFPAAADGFSSIVGWTTALEMLANLDVEAVIPGHGEPRRDSSYLHAVRDLFLTLTDQVRAGIRQGAGLERIRETLDLSAFTAAHLGDDERAIKAFDTFFVIPAVEIAYRELSASGR